MQLRDELGTVYTDEQFATLYPQGGQFAEQPWRIALLLVMQYLENYTDRQAAEAMRTRIDWKYVLSLELTDPGFDFSVLSECASAFDCGRTGRGTAEHALAAVSRTRLAPASAASNAPIRPMCWRPSVR